MEPRTLNEPIEEESQMPNETGMATIADLPPVQLGWDSEGLTISFPGCSGNASSVGSVTIPSAGHAPIDLDFPTGIVVSLPGTAVDTVTIPQAQSGDLQIELPEEGTGLIDLPQGGNLIVTIPQGPTRKKLKVTVKTGDGARLFTEAAAM